MSPISRLVLDPDQHARTAAHGSALPAAPLAALRAQGQILDSKEFYAPIITPFEAQLAFAPDGSAVQARYSLGFDDLMPSAAPSLGEPTLFHAFPCDVECTAAGCLLIERAMQKTHQALARRLRASPS